MKKKICFINCSSRGSTGNIVGDLSRFCAEDYVFCYIFGDKPNNFNKDNTLIIAHNNVLYKISRCQTFVCGNDGFLSHHYAKKISKFLNKQKPDLIHLHNPHRSFFNIKTLFSYCRQNNIKIIWTLHDEWCITGRCCYTRECNGWRSGCGNCKHKDYYPRSVYDRSSRFFTMKRELYSKLDQDLIFVTPSNWLKRRIKSAGLNNTSLVINNGIDTSVFKLCAKNKDILDFAKGRIIIGGAALFFNDLKGFEVFEKLSKELPSSEYAIVLIGSDIDSPKPISNNLYLLPRTSSKEEMASFYNSINIFVNPTKADNYPTTHLESISCGTPVITYNVGGAPEAIIEGVNGFSVEYGDIHGIIEKIKTISSNPEMYNRQRIINSKNTSLGEYCKQYKKLYQKYIK